MPSTFSAYLFTPSSRRLPWQPGGLSGAKKPPHAVIYVFLIKSPFAISFLK